MELQQAIFGRRSIRKFQARPVEEEKLRAIVEAGIHAPSGINSQPWYFVVVHSPEQFAKLKELLLQTAHNFRPALLKRFGERNPEVVEETCQYLKTLGGASTCILAFYLKPEQSDTSSISQSISAAIQNMLLTAYDIGLGACWMTAPIEAGVGDAIRQAFAPEHGKLLACVALGYPDQSPKAPPRREGRYTIV